MNVKKVVMFQASDSSLHATEELCELHNLQTDFIPKIRELLVPGLENQFDESIVFKIEDVCQFVSKNSAALFAILQPLQPPEPKKSRVSRKEKEALQALVPAATPETPAALEGTLGGEGAEGGDNAVVQHPETPPASNDSDLSGMHSNEDQALKTA